MTVFRAPSFFLAGILAGSLAAQASDNTLRTLSTEGIAFKLPAGWAWQSELASNIAIQKEIKVKEQAYTITAEMVFQAEGFLEETITALEKKVKTSKGDLKDFKLARGEKFAGTNAVLVSYVRTRGEKQDELEDERQWIFRRNNALFTWTERAHRLVHSPASGAFSAARNAITFTGKDLSRVPKVFDDQGFKYAVPADWEYEKVEKSDDPKVSKPILRIESVATLKDGAARIGIQVFAVKDDRTTLDDMAKKAKEDAELNFGDLKDFELKDRQLFNGEKAVVATYTGTPDPKRPAHEQPRLKVRWVYMKRKGHRIMWLETGPVATSPQIEASLKKAREALSWL